MREDVRVRALRIFHHNPLLNPKFQRLIHRQDIAFPECNALEQARGNRRAAIAVAAS
jgi:hypothetical protein